MTGRDQGAARSQPYRPVGRCGCGHLETLHSVPGPARRGPCSASTCTCPRYTEEKP